MLLACLIFHFCNSGFFRILEFDVPNVEASGERRTLEIELWDVSGDRK